MRHEIKIALFLLLPLFFISLIPSHATPLGIESYEHSVNDYFYLKFKNINSTMSPITGFPLPASNDINWMIEVTSQTEAPPWDTISGDVSEYIGGANPWNVLYTGGFSRYNETDFQIAPSFQSFFPVPFIIPTNSTNTTELDRHMLHVFNETMRNLLLNVYHYQHYSWSNGTKMLEMAKDVVGEDILASIPFAFYGYCYAWNGSMSWIQRDMRYDPLGNQTGDNLLLAVYFTDGELHYLRESWWNNETLNGDDGYGIWHTTYKMVSPLMEYLGVMFESIFPGAEVSSEMIPSFPY
ncbi:MAG: hypothetical protein ACTSQQ_16285, partial [Candidatus Helarchaeota archaeon]